MVKLRAVYKLLVGSLINRITQNPVILVHSLLNPLQCPAPLLTPGLISPADAAVTQRSRSGHAGAAATQDFFLMIIHSVAARPITNFSGFWTPTSTKNPRLKQLHRHWKQAAKLHGLEWDPIDYRLLILSAPLKCINMNRETFRKLRCFCKPCGFHGIW